jgi:hypothetical protein
LSWVGVDLLNKHMRLLLIHLSYVLLLGFVLLEPFLRLVSRQLRVRSSFGQIWIVICSLLLFGHVLLLGFHLGRIAVVAAVNTVLVLATAHHHHSCLTLDWHSLCLGGRWVVLLAVVSCELVFVLQEWVLTYVVLLLLWELLTDRSHHACILSWRGINFIDLLFALIETSASRLVWFDAIVWVLVWNSIF